MGAAEELQQLREEQRNRLAQDLHDLRDSLRGIGDNQLQLSKDMGMLSERINKEIMQLRETFARASEAVDLRQRVSRLETDRAKLVGIVIALTSLDSVSDLISWFARAHTGQ